MAEVSRMCVACRQVAPKEKLLRVVKSKGGFSVDESGRADGRGAYLCVNRDCLAKCVKKRLFNRSFKCTVDDTLYNDVAILVEEFYKQVDE